MAEVTLILDRLVVILHGFERTPTGIPGRETLTLDLELKNPIGSPGTVRRIPAMEVWDDLGHVYTPEVSDEYANPILADEAFRMRPRFDIPVEAMALQFVLKPGMDVEHVVELVPG